MMTPQGIINYHRIGRKVQQLEKELTMQQEDTLESLVSEQPATSDENKFAWAADIFREAEEFRRTKRAEMKALIGVDKLSDYPQGPRSAVTRLVVLLHQRKEDMNKWNAFIIHELLDLVPGNSNGYFEKIAQPGVAVLAS